MDGDLARFFVVFMPWGRVGSNLVMASLADSSDIVIDNEPTTRLKTFGIREGLPPSDISAQQLDQLLSFHETHRATRRVGVLKLSHRSLIEPRIYAEQLAKLGFRPIIMVRENFLKCAVSQLRASARSLAPIQQRKNWQSPWAVASSEPKPGPVHIDPALAIRLCREFEEHHHALLETLPILGERAMRIEYRDLASDPKAVVARFYEAFGLAAPRRICLPHRKATSDILSDDISNYPEFAQAVADSGLGRFLDAKT